MRQVCIAISLLSVLAGLIYAYPKIEESSRPSLRLFSLPPRFALEIMSLGNRELLSALIFYKSEFYFGEKVGWAKERPEIKRLYIALDKATDLDPRNMDCYYFAQGILSWTKPAIPDLNRLLEKGMKYREHDWYLPFFISANYYFQLEDPIRAAKYLKQAARLNPGNSLLATLTARMLYQGNRTDAAIIYLKSIIQDTGNPILRKRLMKRLEALDAIGFLERAVAVYVEKTGGLPKSLEDLVSTGIIKTLPEDPYGGTFSLNTDGRIYTTSNMAENWKENGHNNHKDH